MLPWTLAFVLLGTVFGDLATSVTDLFANNPAAAFVLAAGATTPDALGGSSLIGIIAAVSSVQTTLKVRFEEMEVRVEPLIATAVRRHDLAR